MNRLKKIRITKDTNIKDQLKKITNANPIISDLVSQTIVKKSIIKSFVNTNKEIYKITTFYVLTSYFDSFIKSKCKKVLNTSYEVVDSKNRSDYDFSFIIEIRVITVLFILVKNINHLFKIFNRRIAHGS